MQQQCIHVLPTGTSNNILSFLAKALLSAQASATHWQDDWSQLGNTARAHGLYQLQPETTQDVPLGVTQGVSAVTHWQCSSHRQGQAKEGEGTTGILLWAGRQQRRRHVAQSVAACGASPAPPLIFQGWPMVLPQELNPW